MLREGKYPRSGRTLTSQSLRLVVQRLILCCARLALDRSNGSIDIFQLAFWTVTLPACALRTTADVQTVFTDGTVAIIWSSNEHTQSTVHARTLCYCDRVKQQNYRVPVCFIFSVVVDASVLVLFPEIGNTFAAFSLVAFKDFIRIACGS